MLFHRNTVPLPNAWPHAKLGRDVGVDQQLPLQDSFAFAFAFARSSPSETASPKQRFYEDMGRMAAHATHNLALQRQKFTDKPRGLVFPICTSCHMGPARYVGKLSFTR